jgi:hypothetical protein
MFSTFTYLSKRCLRWLRSIVDDEPNEFIKALEVIESFIESLTDFGRSIASPS